MVATAQQCECTNGPELCADNGYGSGLTVLCYVYFTIKNNAYLGYTL